MSIVIGGTFRVPPASLAGLKTAMAAMLAASRAEDGCVVYSYAEDVLEPGLIRVFEIWRDQAAVDAHMQAPHMADWRAAGAAVGVADRDIQVYEAGPGRRI